MSIYKRNDVWWVDVTAPNGQRIRCSASTKSKKQAQEYHDKLKYDLWKTDKLNQSPDKLFDEAIIRFIQDAEGQKDIETKKRHARFFRLIFKGKSISSLTSDDLVNAIPIYNAKYRKKLSPATQNRYRSSLMRIMSLAYKSGWIDRLPYIPKKEEPRIRVRWITKEQANSIIYHLKLEWMKNVCTFALLTGARMSEIFSLTWDKIDFVQKIAIVSNENAKSGKARALLLNDQAITLLKSMSHNVTKYVFSRHTGKRIYDIDRRDFSRALKFANVTDFNFHDLRHTWASWHVQAGTPLFTLKELGGWETLEMVKKYAHLNASHLINHANNVTFATQK